MSIIERLYEYMDHRGLSVYQVERACAISNGRLGKQRKAKGGVGSDILEKIKTSYPELSIVWLFTGKGKMLIDPSLSTDEGVIYEMNEEVGAYISSKDEVISLLKSQVQQLEIALADKQKLIALLEKKVAEHT